MPISQYPSTCLSDRPHGKRISDVALHYSGCLPAAKRGRFFVGLPPEAQQRIARQQERIAALREKLETTKQDTSAGTRLADFQHALNQWRSARGRSAAYPAVAATAFSRAPSALAGRPWLDAVGVDADIKAPVVFFRDGQPYDAPGIPGAFPNQKVTVEQLLADNPTRNPLMQPCPDNEVRYFHLPANNMVWVEEVMARYYRETRPEPDDFLLKSQGRRSLTRTGMLLRPEFWQGQCNFDGNSEVHARHMRPFCDVISVGGCLFSPAVAG